MEKKWIQDGLARASSTALANSPKFLYLRVANASFPSRVFGTPSPSRQVKASGRSIHTEDKPSACAGTWSCGSDCATTRICSRLSDGSSACSRAIVYSKLRGSGLFVQHECTWHGTRDNHVNTDPKPQKIKKLTRK
jgi:hypothetical protein